MPGTSKGGKKAAESNTNRYGKDFYAKIGALGGRRGSTGGFYVNRELASIAGRLGGQTSRKGLGEINPELRLKLRKQFQKNYKHLLQIQVKAQKQRRRELVT